MSGRDPPQLHTTRRAGESSAPHKCCWAHRGTSPIPGLHGEQSHKHAMWRTSHLDRRPGLGNLGSVPRAEVLQVAGRPNCSADLCQPGAARHNSDRMAGPNETLFKLRHHSLPSPEVGNSCTFQTFQIFQQRHFYVRDLGPVSLCTTLIRL